MERVGEPPLCKAHRAGAASDHVYRCARSNLVAHVGESEAAYDGHILFAWQTPSRQHTHTPELLPSTQQVNSPALPCPEEWFLDAPTLWSVPLVQERLGRRRRAFGIGA